MGNPMAGVPPVSASLELQPGFSTGLHLNVGDRCGILGKRDHSRKGGLGSGHPLRNETCRKYCIIQVGDQKWLTKQLSTM